jgi:hypothetical protein
MGYEQYSLKHSHRFMKDAFHETQPEMFNENKIPII